MTNVCKFLAKTEESDVSNSRLDGAGNVRYSFRLHHMDSSADKVDHHYLLNEIVINY